MALLRLAPCKLSRVGIAFALLAGVAWACYILLSARPASAGPDSRGSPSPAWSSARSRRAVDRRSGTRLLQPEILLLGLAVGLLSSVIPVQPGADRAPPYPPRVFGILMSLEPAAAAMAAMILLGEFLSLTQWLARELRGAGQCRGDAHCPTAGGTR